MIFTVAALACCAMAGCDGVDKGETTVKVAVDIVPLADFCRNVGGELVEVQAMVPPGSSPHTYELTSGQMRFLSEADLLVSNGLDLTPWAEEVMGKVDNHGLVTVVAGEVIPPRELIEAEGIYGKGVGDDREFDHGLHDPHIWLDPVLAARIVESIRDGLIEADPANEPAYRANADRYLEELSDLDNWIREQVESFSSTRFVSFHSSWTYFARRYGLEQVAVIEELPGKEPAAGWIASLIDMIRDQGVRAIFAEPQFNTQTAQSIAEEAGAEVVMKVIDPLGDPGNVQTDTYLKTIKHDVQSMGEALK